jgi:DNA-binding NarL/FixJ family response regulator
VLVDRHELGRRGLAIMLGQAPDIRVVGQAETIASAAQLVRELSPHLVLLDERSAEGAVAAAVESIRTASTGTRIVVLNGGDVIRAGSASDGVFGWLPRESPVDDLLAIVRAAARGLAGDAAWGAAGGRS